MTTTATRQKWFELLEKWEASGLGAAAFADSQDETVTAERLHRWKWIRKKLSQGPGQAKQKRRFIQLKESERAESHGVEIVSKSGWVVRVPVGFDAVTLTRLLVVVEGGGR